MIPAILQSQYRSQRANRRARIAHKQIGIFVRKFAACARDIVVMLGYLSNRYAQCMKRRKHHAGVVRVEHIAHARDLPFLT